ncbi:MAG: hypothetical protein RL557_794 [archaeon]|jgi:hypothetical protein
MKKILAYMCMLMVFLAVVHVVYAQEEVAFDELGEETLVNEESVGTLSEEITDDTGATASSLSVTSGHGWAISSDNKGALARILIVEKSDKAKGTIKVGKLPAHRIVLTSETATSMNFDVYGKDKETVGTLALTTSTTAGDLTVWTGTLTVDSATHTMSLATMKRENVKEPSMNDRKPKRAMPAENAGGRAEGTPGQKTGFLARLRAFFGGNK